MSTPPTWTARHAGRPDDDLAGIALLFRSQNRSKQSRRQRSRMAEVVEAFADLIGQRKRANADDDVALLAKARTRLHEDCRGRVQAAMAQVADHLGPLPDVIDDELALIEALRSRQLLREAMRAVRRRTRTE